MVLLILSLLVLAAGAVALAAALGFTAQAWIAACREDSDLRIATMVLILVVAVAVALSYVMNHVNEARALFQNRAPVTAEVAH